MSTFVAFVSISVWLSKREFGLVMNVQTIDKNNKTINLLGAVASGLLALTLCFAFDFVFDIRVRLS